MTDRAEVFIKDDMSIAVEGYREVSIDSQLAEAADASALGRHILRWHALPHWVMPAVVLMGDELSPAEFAALMGLEVSDKVLLPLLSHPEGPTPSGSTEWVVEGWTEEWSRDGHRVTLAVSDRTQLGVVAGWHDVWTDTWEIET